MEADASASIGADTAIFCISPKDEGDLIDVWGTTGGRHPGSVPGYPWVTGDSPEATIETSQLNRDYSLSSYFDIRRDR
jgi:hypothetical protein